MKAENQLLLGNIQALVEILEEEMAKLESENPNDDKVIEILGVAVVPHDQALTLFGLADQVMTQIVDQEEKNEFVRLLRGLLKRFVQVSGRWHKIVDSGLGRNWRSYYL